MEAAFLAPYFCQANNETRIERRPRATKRAHRRPVGSWWRALLGRKVVLARVPAKPEPVL
jgi:hypothetical protein